MSAVPISLGYAKVCLLTHSTCQCQIDLCTTTSFSRVMGRDELSSALSKIIGTLEVTVSGSHAKLVFESQRMYVVTAAAFLAYIAVVHLPLPRSFQL